MCGIFATTRLDLWRDRVDEVLGVLRHRGPDAEGSWIDEEAGVLLIHTRLAIVGLGAEGRQPHALGRSVLVYNGEIYNHARVARSLGLEPPPSDTQTVHEVLRRNGPLGLSLLDGMFALAWWDGSDRRLVVARDPWGIKPLYVHRHSEGGITVASELSVIALLRPNVDPYGLAHYVAFGHTTARATVYESVTKLPPGSYIERRAAGNRWLETGDNIVAPDGSDGELGHLVEQAVADQLMADVPVGILLSSGTDSTLLAAAAARQGAALRSFTLSFPEAPGHDESVAAARNAARLGLVHSAVPATTQRMVSRAGRVTASAGEPMADAAVLAVDIVAEHAAEYVKVVLTGEGADELFGGYVRYRLNARLVAAHVDLAGPFMTSAARFAASRRGDKPWQRAAVAALSGGGALGYAALQQAELSVFVHRDDLFAALLAELRSDWELAVNTSGEADAAHVFDQRRWLPNTYLEKIDRATMRHGLEGRVPYLGGALTGWARLTNPRGKQLLVAELRRLLPDAELPDRKKGLAIDVRALLRHGLSDQLQRVLGSQDSVLRNVLGDVVVAALRRRTKHSPTFAYRLAMVGVWEEATCVRS